MSEYGWGLSGDSSSITMQQNTQLAVQHQPQEFYNNTLVGCGSATRISSSSSSMSRVQSIVSGVSTEFQYGVSEEGWSEQMIRRDVQGSVGSRLQCSAASMQMNFEGSENSFDPLTSLSSEFSQGLIPFQTDQLGTNPDSSMVDFQGSVTNPSMMNGSFVDGMRSFTQNQNFQQSALDPLSDVGSVVRNFSSGLAGNGLVAQSPQEFQPVDASPHRRGSSSWPGASNISEIAATAHQPSQLHGGSVDDFLAHDAHRRSSVHQFLSQESPTDPVLFESLLLDDPDHLAAGHLAPHQSARHQVAPSNPSPMAMNVGVASPMPGPMLSSHAPPSLITPFARCHSTGGTTPFGGNNGFGASWSAGGLSDDRFHGTASAHNMHLFYGSAMNGATMNGMGGGVGGGLGGGSGVVSGGGSCSGNCSPLPRGSPPRGSPPRCSSPRGGFDAWRARRASAGDASGGWLGGPPRIFASAPEVRRASASMLPVYPGAEWEGLDLMAGGALMRGMMMRRPGEPLTEAERRDRRRMQNREAQRRFRERRAPSRTSSCGGINSGNESSGGGGEAGSPAAAHNSSEESPSAPPPPPPPPPAHIEGGQAVMGV